MCTGYLQNVNQSGSNTENSKTLQSTSPVLQTSISNGSKPLEWFLVRIGTGNKPLQLALPQEKLGPFQMGQFPPENLAVGSPVFSRRFGLSVLIVSCQDLYLKHAVLGVLSPTGSWFWFWAIFIVWLLKTHNLGMILGIISWQLNE